MQDSGRFIKIILTFIKHNLLVFLLVLIAFSIGGFLGAMGVSNLSSENVNELNSVVDTFLTSVPEMEINSSTSVKNALIDNVITWGVIFLMGLTIIGIPVVLVIVFMRGFTLGFVITFLTVKKSSPGALLAATSVVPHNLLFVPALFISAVSSVSFSLILLKRFFNNQIPVGSAFLGYCGIMVGTGIILSISAFVQAYFTPWLARFASSLINGGLPLPF